MINWFNMPDEGLSNGGLFEVKELDVTENGTYETKGEMYNKVTVNVEGGGGETWETVFEDSVTTEVGQYGAMAFLDYSEIIDADTIKVTFGGVEYECERIDMGDTEYAYGGVGEHGFDFSQYPFAIMSSSDSVEVANAIYTETAGTYTLKIEEPQSGGSSDFSTAKVVITNSTSSNYMLSNFVVIESSLLGDTMGYDCTVEANSTKTVLAVLYKNEPADGKIEGYSSDIEVAYSGDITDDGDGYFIITGDGTITIMTK